MALLFVRFDHEGEQVEGSASVVPFLDSSSSTSRFGKGDLVSASGSAMPQE
jgi:hypothetical protein